MSEDLTFKEITQIALGGVNFEHLNVSLLYAIIDLLLKKLNCENEKVLISGVPAKSLQELLSQSISGPPLVSREEKLKTPVKPYEKLDELEKQVEKLENDLGNHMEDAKIVKYVPEDSEDSSDVSGIMPCTLFCDVEEPENEVIGALLKNKWFLMQLKEFLKFPIVCRFNKLEIKLREFEKAFKNFKIDCESMNKRIDKKEEFFVDFLELQKVIRENHAEFLTTMDEIQGVMDAKVNNFDMPPLKHSVYGMIKRLANEVNYMKYVETMPRALLCTADPSAIGKISQSLSDKFTTKKRSDKTCKCQENMIHPTLRDRIDFIDKEALIRRSTMEALNYN